MTLNLPRGSVDAPIRQTFATSLAGVSYVKELPKTGLPALAWAAAAFLPIGLKFRRFGRTAKFDSNISANYLWEVKRFKKDL